MKESAAPAIEINRGRPLHMVILYANGGRPPDEIDVAFVKEAAAPFTYPF
jgi:hypothetical protein